MKELYDHQKVAVEDLRAGIRDGHKLQVLAASTGFGKSIVAMHLIHSSMKKGKRCLFLVDRRVLVDQFSQHLADNGIDHGVLMAKHWRWRPNKSVQVASVQTMERMETWPVFDLVVIDEVHAVMRDSVCAMLAKTSAVVVGLTATPFHHRLAQHFSRISNTITMAELVKMGALVPFKVFASREIDVGGLKAQGDSWEKEKLQSRALQVVGDVVSDYATLSAQVFGGPRKTIVFSSGVEHGKELARRFQEAGHNFISISYKDDEDHKKSILEEFARPDTTLQGIISTDILTRGFDQTDVEHVILAQPLRKSFSKFVQMIGRGARKHDGKEFCLIQDNSGNWLRFQSEWESLFHGGVHALPEGPDDKNRKERTEKEKEASCCPKCKQVWSAGAEVCSFCGHARERRSDVAEVAGVMQEVTGAQVERFDGATKERWFQELLKYARHHGYKDGWAFFAYQDKFGIKPSWKKTCAPSISPDVAGWITHRNIRRQHAARR